MLIKTLLQVLLYFSETFFSMAKLPLNQILELGYHWLSKASVSTIIAQTERSPETACVYAKYFRELAVGSLDEADFCIGRPGVVIELYESKLGKCKYH